MIFGIGVDIVETARVDKLHARFGTRFAGRILTGDEMIEFERRGDRSGYLAKRFAAKEAVAKALGTGIGKELGFHSVDRKRRAWQTPIKVCRRLGRDDFAARHQKLVHLAVGRKTLCRRNGSTGDLSAGSVAAHAL